ncbi:MAG: DUF488 domain-containing protein [Candidatus Omnitrophica bacterium]|nr:DUF488 domain-containing protein [Candidatus Omnitrophota bacterium]MCA9426100.1 DUF488 domain-containing protein [Candidatus Omnitrophota bacterium]MCA9432998.1 DUF488 domain-containing protein [Candidatus Omnitrophota bacterium]MCA9437600.1 DUF488 domain-containing protein [Candidatus Omnitrophota bacterium]
MKIYTIGFTKKNAKTFFGLLDKPDLKRLVDVRLNNSSQLAGFAKRDDLEFFLNRIRGIPYEHLPDLAPTQDILDDFKKKKGEWSVYEKKFLALMRERHIEETIPRETLDGGCLLCSEDKPHLCHRRLVAEYLQEKWGDVEVEHLG